MSVPESHQICLFWHFLLPRVENSTNVTVPLSSLSRSNRQALNLATSVRLTGLVQDGKHKEHNRHSSTAKTPRFWAICKFCLLLLSQCVGIWSHLHDMPHPEFSRIFTDLYNVKHAASDIAIPHQTSSIYNYSILRTQWFLNETQETSWNRHKPSLNWVGFPQELSKLPGGRSFIPHRQDESLGGLLCLGAMSWHVAAWGGGFCSTTWDNITNQKPC